MKNRLRVLRAERNWSQADLAERLDVSRQSVNAIETGKFDPSLPLAFRLARLFSLPIEQIFTDQGRLRENMKALKGSVEEKTLLQRYTRQLDEEETQLEALRRAKKDTEVQQKLANSVLYNMIQELQADVTL